jgi:hypothetical protein
MSDYLQWRYLAALGPLAVLGAFAQPTSPISHPSPAPAASAITQANTTPYRSAFESYQPFAEEKILPWKEANDTVRAIGGWRAYTKEANEEAGASRAPPAGSVDPAAGRAKP